MAGVQVRGQMERIQLLTTEREDLLQDLESDRHAKQAAQSVTALEATQGQMDGFSSQLYANVTSEEVASVED